MSQQDWTDRQGLSLFLLQVAIRAAGILQVKEKSVKFPSITSTFWERHHVGFDAWCLRH